MYYDIPEWLIDDMQRRHKIMKFTRRKRFYDFTVDTLFIFALSLLFGLILFMVYALNVGIHETTEEQSHTMVTATITAYTSSVDETDDTPFETASMTQTRRGVIACPSKYEFGTQVVIEGRQYTCEDRMNRRYRDQERFDIWVETKDEAFTWGVRELPVRILTLN